MTGKIRRIISLTVIALILVVVLAANVVAGIFSQAITVYLYGYGIDFSGMDQAQLVSDELCREIAGEGIVMLKNQDTLPLNGVTALNVFGWGATDGGFVISGSGSGSSFEDAGSEAGKVKLLLEALEECGFEYNDELIKMYKSFQAKRDKPKLLDTTAEEFFRLYEPARSAYTSEIMEYAKSFSDTALIVISRLGGEGGDIPFKQNRKLPDGSFIEDTGRTYLELSPEEADMIDVVTNAGFENVIVIINACNVMELGFLDKDGIDAALAINALGQSGAVSLGKILKGEITPSGKTADTFPYNLEDDPTYVNAGLKGVTGYISGGGRYIDYCEGIYVGYRYYETADAEGYINYNETVLYPFGYGLSYTKFDWEVTEVNPAHSAQIPKDGKIEIKVEVTNTGTAKGQDVVQLYYSPPYKEGEIEKAEVNLCAFAKTAVLAPGTTQSLTLSFDIFNMASYDSYDMNGNSFRGYELEGGDYYLTLRTDAHSVYSNDPEFRIKYTVPAEGYRYESDPVSGKVIKNRFTGTDAYGGVDIDGSNSGANNKYLSRANFGSTFPSVKKAARAKANMAAFADGWGKDNVYATGFPKYAQDGSLSLTYTENGTLKINDELVQKLGSDYYAPEWDSLLDQLTVSELVNLVAMAGYRTAQADSVGKPKCIDLDGPTGLNQSNMSDVTGDWTGFPVETVVAQSWNSFLAYSLGLAIGYEASITQVSGWYAPAMNMHRSQFGGRNFEYYSEDPYLSGILGAETTNGALTNGLYCYIKHFAVNETETNRTGLYTWLTEQALREIYLKPFEITVKQGHANAVMSAFNRLGPVWTGGNRALLTDILRDEWGFQGSVVTDWSTGNAFMNMDQAIRAGGDCLLNGMNTSGYGGFSDKTSATAITMMRQAAKNILYTYTNTYYYGTTTESGIDRFKAEIGVKTVNEIFPWWVFGIAAIDLAALAGTGLWVYFLFFRKKKEGIALVNN